jgi:hypothetical protein
MESPVNERQRKKLERLLSESARLRETAEELAEEATRLRAEIAAETRGRVVERRKKPRRKGK